MVLTVINLDNGAVASAQLVPGAVEPVRIRTERFWRIEVQSLVDDLAQRTGGVCAEEFSAGDVMLPEDYSPHLPDDERARLEAVSLVSSMLGRHRTFIARSTAPEPNPDPDAKLAALCRLGQRLCLDVVIWRYSRQPGRAAGWWLGLQPAGMGLPSGEPYGGSQLDGVLSRAEARRLLVSMDMSGFRFDRRDTPGYFLTRNAGDTTAGAEAIGTVADLAAELHKREGKTGAVAIWRDGAWHYSPVSRTGTRHEPPIRSTGTPHLVEVPMWGISEPPAPSYWDEPIPTYPCSGCHTGQAWSACTCVLGTDVSDPDCPQCAGTGQRQTPTCFVCGDIGKLHEGVVITVTDLHNYARHINFVPAADIEVARAGHQPRNPDLASWQLPESYRLTTHFFDDGVDLAHANDTVDSPIASSLVNATVLAPAAATPYEVTTAWCIDTAKREVAARSFVIVTTPRRDKLSTLVNIAVGLGFEIVVACRFRSLAMAEGLVANTGTRWGIKILTPGDTIEYPNSLTGMNRYLSADVAHELNYIASWYQANHQPTPTATCPIFNQPLPAATDADRLETVLAHIATQHDFDTITTRITPTTTTITRHLFGPARHALPNPDLVLARGATIAEALSPLE